VNVQELASCSGYGVDSLPFVYLFLPIGEGMYRVNSWRHSVIKFQKRLANWKSKLMSIANRLVKVVDSLVSPKQSAFIKGCQITDSVLMGSKINGACGSEVIRINLDQDVWQWKFDPSFWKDVWCGDRMLEARFPRMATLASDRNALVFKYWSSHGWNIIWWRKIRGEVELSQDTQLMSCIQVNVFVWRAMLNRLPTRTNLDRRGIDMDSLICPYCNTIMEDSNHVFYSCNVALELWNKITVWLDLQIPEFDNMAAMFQWIDGHNGDSLLCPCCNTIVEDSNHVFYSCNVALELWNKIAVWLDLNIPEFDNMAAMFQWIDGHDGVPTGRVVVPTSRYVVPAGNVIIVSSGRLSLIPTGRVLSPGFHHYKRNLRRKEMHTQKNKISPDISFYKQESLLCLACDYISYSPSLTGSKDLSRPGFQQVKDEYEVWAMKMEYWITNNDMNILKVIQNGNNLKRTVRDRDRRVIILPPTTADEHIVIQRELKARTTLLQFIPVDHVADFHYMDDAKDIWNAVKAWFGGNAESKKMRKSTLKQEFSEFKIGEAEGLHKGYDRMQKILSQLNQLKAKPEDEDINLKFLRALHSLWSQVALTLKTKGPNHSAFVSTTGASKKMSYGDSPSYSSTTTYTAPSNSKTGSHRSGNVIEDVLQSFIADTEPKQQLAYEDFEQIEKLDLEEMDLKWQMAMLSVRVHKFEQKAGRKIDFDKKESARFNKKKRYSSFKIKEIGKKEKDSKALITVDTLVDWTNHDGESDGVIAFKEFGMTAGCDTEDAIEEGAAKIYNLITEADTKEATTAGDAGEFALMGVTSENILLQVQAYKNSLKILEKQKRVLQRNQLTLEDKIKALSIELENTSNLLKHSKRINADVETAKKELQTKLDNHLVRTKKWRISSKILFRLIDSSMSVRTKVGLGFNNYIRENELGWDDSAFSVFTTNSEDVEGRPLFNRFAKADSMKAVPPPLSGDYTSLSDHIDLDESQMFYGTKSLTSSDSKSVSNDFVSCDDSDKSLEVNTNDFASSDSSVKSSKPKPNDSTSCASTSSDLPNFSCNSSAKNENTSRTSCNKNSYFNKKACHFRKNASSVSKLCFVCGSGTHLIKDCNFYEKQMVNKTIGIRVVPVHSRNKVNHHNQFVPQAVLLRTSKVNIPHARSQPVPTDKPKVFAPVPIGRQNRPFLVPSDRGYSPSVIFGWWKNGQLLLSPQQVVLGKHIEKVYTRVFDSGCSRSMTGNKERLDDFQVFQGGKVTFGGGEDTECLVLSKDFKLPDESMVVLRVPRKHNLYTINLNNLCPRGNLACLVVHASVDESVKWHRRMGHVNYKNINILVKGNLVRGLPPKLFKNDHTCVACCKGKQHKASYKTINAVSFIFELLQLLYMDLFVPTSIRSIDHKYYCLVITNDYSRFRWVFFLDHKDETYPILKDFINLVANQLNKKVQAMRRDNGTELKNAHIIELYGTKGIKREYSNARTPHHFKPFGCHVTILNTSDHLGKFNGKADEGYIIGYSASNKAYRVYNVPNKKVEETMNLRYLEKKPNVQGLGHEWYFDLDYLTNTLGYKHDKANQSAGAQEATTNPAGTQDDDLDSDCDEQVIIVPSYPSHNIQGTEPKDTSGQEQRATSDARSLGLGFANDAEELQKQASAKPVPPGSIPVPTGSVPVPSDLGNHDPSPGIFSSSSYDDELGAALNNIASTVERDNHTDFQHCLFACFLPQVEPRSVAQALEDPSSVDAMQEEMQQFKFQNVWVPVDLPEEEAQLTRLSFLRRTTEISSRGTYFLPRLQVQQRPNGIFINQDKYVQEILNKFDLGSVRTATTPYEAPKPKSKDECDSLVNVHLYISMIGSLMYLTALRSDIMFAVSACLRNQVTPTTSNLEAVKKIFKYLKGQPKLSLWYPRESPLVLQAYSDSDYARANKDRKSTTGGCQFLGRRLILWQCKKQTIMATSSTEAESYELGPLAIQAPIDKTPYTITEDLVRSKLQLADDGGIDDLPIAEIYSRMDNLGLNFEAHSIPLLAAMLSQDQEGEGVGVAAQAVPHHMHAPDQSRAHLPTPPRQHTSNPNALVFNHGQSSDPNIASFSRTHETDDDPFTNVEDEPLEGSFCLSQVEAKLVEFKTQEIKFCEKIRGLEFDVKEVSELIRTRKVLDTVLFPPPAQVYSPPKKDMSWTGLPEFADDTITDYSRPSPTVESNTSDLQNSNSSVFEHGESSSSILFKPMIKFVKAADCPEVIKTNKVKTARKSPVKYAKMYRNTSKSPKVKGNQRNWNNLKSQQLGKDFLMKNKACFKCGHFDHLAYDCGVWVEKGKNWPKNNSAHKNVTSKADLHKTGRTLIRVNRPNMNVAQPKRTYFAKTAHSYVRRPFHGRSAVRTQSQVLRVSTVTKRFPTIDLKFSTIKSTFSAN
nr:putative ribonuclease H-like domain-containing protein [Tanacetum cinerariifolium]